LDKWKRNEALTGADIRQIEGACYQEMLELGYTPVSDTTPVFTKQEIQKFRSVSSLSSL